MQHNLNLDPFILKMNFDMLTRSLILMNYLVVALLNAFINVNQIDAKRKIFLQLKTRLLTRHLNNFLTVTPCGTVYIDSHSPDVTYLITCARCYLQYVEETDQKINERSNWHKTCQLNNWL